MFSTRLARTLTLTVSLAATLPAQTGSGQPPSFEVASIKPTPPDSAHFRRKIDPTLLVADGLSLQRLIMMAYDVGDYQAFLVTGGPEWVDKVAYELEARTSSPSSRQEMLLMLRTLLADRFQLKLHRETRPLAANVLVVAKGGLRFGPQFHQVKEGDPPVGPGKQSAHHLTYPGVPMQTFVDRLGIWLTLDPMTHTPVDDALPVLDQTGLDGRYFIVFDADPQEDWSAALEHQFGLKLERRKVPADMIVIDSAARPSAN